MVEGKNDEPNISGKILKRILGSNNKISIEELLKLKPTDFQSILLLIYERIAKRIKPNDILEQYHDNRFVTPCDLSQRTLLLFDLIAYDIVGNQFESIELSPVNPLGINSVLAQINQKNVLSTIRNIEVVADLTSALVVELARLRKEFLKIDPACLEEINLCSSHRCMRLQKFQEDLGFTSHFRVFGTCTAGKVRPYREFEFSNLVKHISLYIDLLISLNKNGFTATEIKVSISDINITEKIIEQFGIERKQLLLNTQTRGFEPFKEVPIDLPGRISSLDEVNPELINQLGIEDNIRLLRLVDQYVLTALRLKYPQVTFLYDFQRIAGLGYYENFCFKISAKNKEGMTYPLSDGGLTDWLKKLLSSKKELVFTSGFGSELFCRYFR